MGRPTDTGNTRVSKGWDSEDIYKARQHDSDKSMDGHAGANGDRTRRSEGDANTGVGRKGVIHKRFTDTHSILPRRTKLFWGPGVQSGDGNGRGSEKTKRGKEEGQQQAEAGRRNWGHCYTHSKEAEGQEAQSKGYEQMQCVDRRTERRSGMEATEGEDPRSKEGERRRRIVQFNAPAHDEVRSGRDSKSYTG